MNTTQLLYNMTVIANNTFKHYPSISPQTWSGNVLAASVHMSIQSHTSVPIGQIYQ